MKHTLYNTSVSHLPTVVPPSTVLILDTETTGLNKLTDKPFMCLMRICDNAQPQYTNDFAMVWTDALVRWLNKYLPLMHSVVCHNAKYDWHMMRNGGVDPDVLYRTKVYDTFIAEALINEHKKSYGLDNLGMEYFNTGKDNDELYRVMSGALNMDPGKKLMGYISQFAKMDPAYWHLVAGYGVQDVNLTYKLWRKQLPELDRQELNTVFALEMRTLKALVEMECRGVPVDVDRVGAVESQLITKQHQIQKAITKEVGWEVNPRSPLQMEKAFLKLGLPVTRLKSGNPSFAKDVISGIDHPFIRLLQESRNVKTMLDTFIGGSIGRNLHNNRIHTDFNQVRGDDYGTGCMTSDTLILTDKGWVPVVDVKIGQQVIDHNGVPQRVIDWFENGTKEIWRVSTAKGHSIHVTANHPFLINGNWVRADHIVIGDTALVYDTAERWCDIPEWPFKISSWGRVYSTTTRRIVNQQYKTKNNKWGHLKVTLVRGDCKRSSGNRVDFPVHRLVASAFCDNRNNLTMVTHMNGIAWDNNHHNLKWGSAKSNSGEGRNHGSYFHQEKLTQEDIDFIRSTTYLNDSQIGRAFGVSRELVRDIRGNLKWNRGDLTPKKLLFEPDIVTSVEVLPPRMTYGIEVENSHTHLTAGIVTHNTGRLSSSQPNLQQIPKRDGELAPLIRGLFAAPRGQLWIANDWEQFEFRVFAHYVKDADLTMRYINDPKTDFHTALAELTGKPRDKAKRINLGLVFGMGEGKLAKELGLPYTVETRHGKEILLAGPEAQALFNEYHSRFPKAKKFLQEASHLAKSRGYVRTIMGRRLRFPNGEFTHKAGGLVFQGTSADIMKKKLCELNDEFRNTMVDFVLVVHDEFDLVAPAELAQSVAYRVKEITEDVPELRIPVLADSGTGRAWWEACTGGE